MILIGNTCATTYAYQHLGMQFNMPFTWAKISIDNLLELSMNFNNIDFDDVKFFLEKDIQWIKLFNVRKNATYPVACIQQKIYVYYAHYWQDSKEYVERHNVHHPNVLKYAYDCYARRLDRMKASLAAGDKPIFLVSLPFKKIKISDKQLELARHLDNVYIGILAKDAIKYSKLLSFPRLVIASQANEAHMKYPAQAIGDAFAEKMKGTDI